MCEEWSWCAVRIVAVGMVAACGVRESGRRPEAAGLAAAASRPERRGIVAGDLGRRLDAYLSGAAGFGFDGVVAAEVGEDLVLLQAYGIADREAGTPTTVDTLFDLGSLSKSYTAALVLALDAEGKLPLGATLGELVEGVPADKAAITVEQLMTHTAGLAYHPDAAADRAAGESRDALLHALLAQPAIAAPGERFAYSSPGYTVLALLCERAGGASFEELLRARVLRPRGLHETTLPGGHELDALPIARSWMDGAGQGTPREWPVTPEWLGAGGVIATASDVLAWMRSLEPAQVEPRTTVRGTLGYAAGFFTARTLRDTPVVYHAGDFMGFNAEARWYPGEGRRLVLLCNVRQSGIGLREPVLHRVARIAAGEEIPVPPLVAADLELRAEREGRYVAADGEALEARAAGGGLLLSTGSAVLARLLGSTPAPAAFAANAARLIEGARSGDFELADELMNAAVVRHEATTVLEEAWREAEASVGEITDVAPAVDVARGADGCGSSWARVHGPRGSRFLEIRWMAARLFGVSVHEEGPTLSLRPIGPDAFASYDLFRDARLDALFRADGSLELTGPQGSVSLVRATTPARTSALEPRIAPEPPGAALPAVRRSEALRSAG